MLIKKIIAKFDYTLFISALLLSLIGIMFIYSANMNKHSYLQVEYLKQMFFLAFGIIILFSTLFVTTRQLKNSTDIFYIIALLGILLTLFFPSVKGQRRFSILGFSLHFSEFMKIAVVFYLAKFFDKNAATIRSLTVYLKAILIVLIPVGAILLQPDLGSSLVFVPILLTMSFIAGIKKRYILYSIAFLATVSFIPIITTINSLYFKNESELIYLMTNSKYITILFIFLAFSIILSSLVLLNIIKGVSERFRVFFYWYLFITSFIFLGLMFSYPANKFVLKDYQKDRLLIFFNPYVDSMNRGYNIIQSMTAIGNGGFLGKGWRNGEMIQNLFVPEQSTDFIYPVIAEELGFVGTALIIFLYSLYFGRGLRIALYAKDRWASYVSVGILSFMLFHILENIGMCLGIMPITGIPLPFISYGGSFIISCFFATAVLLNFNINRYQY